MSAKIIDGKAISARVKDEVASQVVDFEKQFGRRPGLDVILVGDDPASHVYVRNKEKAAEKAGIVGNIHRLAEDTSMEVLLSLIEKLNKTKTVDGILVQLPLPKSLDGQTAVDAIDPNKDVDGLHPINAGLLTVGRAGLRPCTPSGCMRMLDEIGFELEGKNALVIGRSTLVGKPIAMMLLDKNATVTIAHSRTQNLAELVGKADVVVAAVGRPKMVKGQWLKKGAVVLDVGINRTNEGKLVGDVDFDAALGKASWITPVPGGVGPMTIAVLLQNTVQAAHFLEKSID